MKPIEDNKLVPIAMEIILHAGDGRNKISEAMEEAKAFKFEEAKALLKDAEKDIAKAHHAQTSTIQEEIAGGEREELVLIFIHAQDTLMTIKSELKMATQMIEMMEVLTNRIEK
ncbi:MAG: PTS lactose/cellobiose transporter subunit IIA [Suipraeoptans sp.]